jgi:hypothetical protein
MRRTITLDLLDYRRVWPTRDRAVVRFNAFDLARVRCASEAVVEPSLDVCAIDELPDLLAARRAFRADLALGLHDAARGICEWRESVRLAAESVALDLALAASGFQ